MDAMQPGAAHKVLAEMAGKWSYTSMMWMSADVKPEESKGKSVMKMIFGGRFLHHEIKGKAMGQPWEGLGYTGFDNVKQKYQTVWMDGMSTGIMHGEATFDAATKTLKDAGSFSCPVTGKDRTYRSEWKITDKNNMLFAMYGVAMDHRTRIQKPGNHLQAREVALPNSIAAPRAGCTSFRSFQKRSTLLPRCGRQSLIKSNAFDSTKFRATVLAFEDNCRFIQTLVQASVPY